MPAAGPAGAGITCGATEFAGYSEWEGWLAAGSPRSIRHLDGHLCSSQAEMLEW